MLDRKQVAACSQRKMWHVVAVLAFGALMMYADRTTLYPMLKVIQDKFGLSGTATGAITSTYFFLYVAMQVPAGLLGDKIGLKRVLMVFFGLGGLALLLLGVMAQSYVLLLLLVGVHGVGMGAFYPTSYGINIGTVPKEFRGLASAIINCGMSVGTALGLAFSGPVYLWSGNWRLPFLLLAVPTLVAPFLFSRYLPDVGKTTGEAQRRSESFSLGQILGDKDLWALNLAAFCSGYGFWVALTWGPSFFATERGLSVATAGAFTALAAVSAIPAALCAGRLSDKVGRKRLTLVLYPMAAVTIFALAYVRSLTALVVLLIIYGLIGRTVSDTIVISWFGDHIARKVPQALGAAVGVFNLVGMSSAIVAPLVSGLVKDLTGSLTGAFYLGAAVVLVGMGFATLAREV
ncbi:MAG: MFS transporter [bacterium]